VTEALPALRQRLNRFLGLSLLLIFCLQWLVAVLALKYSAESYVVSRLRHDAESLIQALDFSPDGVPLLAARQVNPTFERPFSGHYYRLHSQGIDFYSRSLWQHDLPLEALAPGQTSVRRGLGPQQQTLLVYSETYQSGPYAVQLVVAEDLGFLNGPLLYLSLGYGLLSLALFLLLLWLQSRVLRQALRPLKQVQTELGELSHSQRQQISEQVPAEILPLIQTLNQLLRLLDQRLTRSRNALANLSHALKKPLTLMRQELQQLNTRAALPPEVQAGLQEQLQRIQTLIEHELRRAQLAGASPRAHRIQLADDLPFLLTLMQQTYAHKALAVQCEIPPGHAFSGDRQDILELLGNLIDNAFQWAQQRVQITVADAPGLLLHIADDGPGCPPELRDYLLQRGNRLDESRPGHGFGLAIALEIVQSYGGQLKLTQHPALGGLCVSVALPAENPSP
jgi:signal transduction histidine kinase